MYMCGPVTVVLPAGCVTVCSGFLGGFFLVLVGVGVGVGLGFLVLVGVGVGVAVVVGVAVAESEGEVLGVAVAVAVPLAVGDALDQAGVTVAATRLPLASAALGAAAIIAIPAAVAAMASSLLIGPSFPPAARRTGPRPCARPGARSCGAAAWSARPARRRPGGARS